MAITEFMIDIRTEHGILADVNCKVSEKPSGDIQVEIKIGDLKIIDDDISLLFEDGLEWILEKYHDIRSEELHEEPEDDYDEGLLYDEF